MLKSDKAKITKIGILAIIFLLTILILMVALPNPVIKIFYTSKSGKLIFNNYSTEETLKLAEKYKKEGSIKTAYSAYKYVIKKDPNNIKAYIGIADIYMENQNFKEAEKYLKEAESKINFKTEPELKVDLYYTMGLLYSQNFIFEGFKDLDRSIEYFNRALNIKGVGEELKRQYESDIYFQLGNIYFMKGMNKESAEYFQKSLMVDSDYISSYLQLAMVYIKMNDYQKAYDLIEKYKNVAGENEYYLFLMGNYYTERGEYKKALDYIDRASYITSDKFMLYYTYGNYYEKTKDIEKARQYYRKAFEISVYSIELPINQEVIKRLNIDVSDLEEKIMKDKEEKYNWKL